MMNSTASNNTMKLLTLIAQHLSGRKELRHVEYVVTIEAGLIWISHNIFVFPNRYTRKRGTQLPVIEHIMQYHCNCKMPELVPGTYKYELSASNKCRRWTRIK